jgi:hypothetical protein
MEWIKLYSKGILSGSLSRSDNTTQLLWVKLMAMVNETRQRDGWLHYAVGKPMERTRIAETCGVSLIELNTALAEFLNDKNTDGTARIYIKEDGDIFLTNWELYQSKPPREAAKEVAISKNKQKSNELGNQLEEATSEVAELRKDIHTATQVFVAKVGDKNE